MTVGSFYCRGILVRSVRHVECVRVVRCTFRLRYDEMGPMRGVSGALDIDFEVQRTIKRPVLTAFLSLSKKDCRSHHDSCGQRRSMTQGQSSRRSWQNTEKCGGHLCFQTSIKTRIRMRV